MKLLENDVALITVLTLFLFSLVRFQDSAPGAAPEGGERDRASLQARP